MLAWCLYRTSTLIYVRVLMLIPRKYLNVLISTMIVPKDEAPIVKLLNQLLSVAFVVWKHLGLDPLGPILQPPGPISDGPDPSEEQPAEGIDLRK